MFTPSPGTRPGQRTVPRFATSIVALLLVACSIPLLGAKLFAKDSAVAMSVEYFQQDSARVIAKWAPGRDAKGPTDSYLVRWTSGAAQRNVTKAVPADTFKVRRPAIGDSVLVSVAVTGVRRGVPSPNAVTASVWVRNPDAPPPPVDSLKVDTLALDSIHLDWETLQGVKLPAVLSIAERDTVRAIAKYYYKAGYQRPLDDVTLWQIERTDDPTAPMYLAVQPLGNGRRDTALFIALPCNCAESGSPNLRLDLRQAAYVVDEPSGATRLATALAPSLSPDPFR